jgi:excisionase family DNA binding protein
MQPKNVQNPYWDIKELSEYLSIKPCTLYAWASQGRLPCLKIHGLVRFHKQEVDQWLVSLREGSKAMESTPMRTSTVDIPTVIARAKRDAYNRAHGETRLRSSPIGKEDKDRAV